uniref:Active regulator of SIRT1 n=1 Tax=Haemonchus contortus TaxID=6289 RepID=A0A7I5ECF9_HAECO
MSEELLLKFLEDIEEEDGLLEKTKRKRTKQELREEHTKRILAAASKGQVELPPEESFIVERPRRKEAIEFDLKLAKQGFSLIEQARAQQPKDLIQRNLKYIKYTDKKRALDKEKAKKIVLEHLRKKTSKELIRRERSKITGLREPRKEKTKKDASVFSDADFAVVGKRKKKLEKAPIEYL